MGLGVEPFKKYHCPYYASALLHFRFASDNKRSSLANPVEII